MTSVFGETRYVTTGQPGTNVILGQQGIFLGERDNPKYCAGCNGSFRLLFDATSIGTDRGVFAVGFDYFNERDESIPDNSSCTMPSSRLATGLPAALTCRPPRRR